jgi:hypothetical protein
MRLWRNPWAAVPLETSLPWATTEVDLVTGTYSARRQYRAAGTVWADDPLNPLPHSRQLHLRLLDWRTAPRQRLSSRRPGPPFGCGRSLADAPTRLLRWPGRQPPT